VRLPIRKNSLSQLS